MFQITCNNTRGKSDSQEISYAIPQHYIAFQKTIEIPEISWCTCTGNPPVGSANNNNYIQVVFESIESVY